MASLARAAASAAKPLAGRSLGSSLPVPTPARAARILRRSAVARLETLLPLHTPVASARLKSCIAVDSTCWSSLSQALSKGGHMKEGRQTSHNPSDFFVFVTLDGLGV
ncbi:hypothetical protein BRADI_3g57657v3 [Brachypodium distachyon]|uniref:Uncharacterized protein n=1 Tax=Brachypodium distachyon TaxID=15368 RepID=A0A0Q3FUH5_BRADI|nr:hypothetical protein BRADI_3g57657v3 [Brachypodium distachyon]